MTLHVAISGWLLGTGPSGANRRLTGILHALPPLLAAGERVTVLHRPAFAPPPLAGLQWLPVPIPAEPTWRRALAERWRLPSLLRALGADVLDHGFLPLPRVPCPVVLTVHDVRDADGHGARARWLGRLALRHAARHAAAIVAPSRFTADRIHTLAPMAHRVLVVANGVDAPAAPITAAPTARPFLLHVGHLEPRKNLEVLLHALSLLPTADRPRLRLVGRDAGDGARLRERAARLGIVDDVEFAGPLGDADLAHDYAHAIAVCLPSIHEGFGLPALEAMAHGTRVLVADAGALPEVTGRLGTVLPATTPAAWAAAIAAVLRTGTEPAAAGERRRHATAFGTTGMAAAMLAAWRQAAACPELGPRAERGLQPHRTTEPSGRWRWRQRRQ